jgi:hypothetical protein
MDIFRFHCRSVLLFVCSLALGTGCRTSTHTPEKANPETTVGTQTAQSGTGYALLFDLMGDEQNVSKLLIIKRERAELNELIKAISKTAGEAHKQLEAFGKADPSLNLKSKGLPPGEVATRASISKAKAKELLTDKGKDFELAMLLSQSEALTYAEHLAITIGVREANASRAEFLRKLAVELARLRLNVRSMLAEHYTWNGT